MSYGFLDIAVTPRVRAARAGMGADHLWQDFKRHREFDRFKIFAHVEALALDDADLAALVTVPGYKAHPERIFRVRLESFDWNCPQHITPRFTEREIGEPVRPLQERLARPETENAEPRARVGGVDSN